MLMRLMSKGEYVIVPKGTKFRGAGKLGLMLCYVSEFLKYTLLFIPPIGHLRNSYLPKFTSDPLLFLFPTSAGVPE